MIENEMNKLINIPNILTFSRIVLLPFFIVAFFLESRTGSFLAIVIFILCCLTDYLDGYYARAYQQTTKFGQFLDPLADKVFISITILFISGFNKISTISLLPAAVILCREIIISGVRDAAESGNKDFVTSRLSKWKTATQMVSISMILIADVFEGPILQYFVALLGEILFWISALVSVISGVRYCKLYIKNLFF